jgi:rRNA maturation endonuclease Nob1
MNYTCKTCGAVAEEPGHLCSPCGDKAACNFCGTPEIDAAHVCKDKLAAMKYVCEGCGRVATEEGHLCKPSAIE